MSSVEPTPTPSPPSALDKTPSRDKLQQRHVSGRKRAAEGGAEPSASRQRTQEPSPDANGQGDENIDFSIYNPDQTLEERRQVQVRMRDWQRNFRENPDEFLQEDDSRMIEYLDDSTKALGAVKQTGEAAIDARGLVAAADLSTRRVQRLLTGGAVNGIDVDEFVSKCITFMLHGGGIEDDAPELSSTQRWHRESASRPSNHGNGDDDDDEDRIGDEGDMFNWAHFGRYACVPSIRRPAVTGFLLGPLSIEKKARKVAARSAPLRIDSLTEVRPEILDVGKLKRDKEDDLVSMARQIHRQLVDLQQAAQDSVEKLIEEIDHELTEEEEAAMMYDHALRDTGGIDYMKFVINPQSFGQTVENIFYVSFLIREGTVKLDYDQNDLPALGTRRRVSQIQDAPTDNHLEPLSTEVNATQKPERNVTRHQAFMSLDMQTWKDVIEAFGIKEPLIPHRQEKVHHSIGAGQWYS